MMERETIGANFFSRTIALTVLVAPLIVGAAQGPKPGPAGPQTDKLDSATWLLAGREGQCVPLSLLAKRGPAYADIKGPADLAEKLRANGHAAEVKEFKAGTRPAVEVRAPSAGIYVMFIKKDLCDRTAPVPEKK
jgi:hypothetical protein